jgi:hypothetical protein
VQLKKGEKQFKMVQKGRELAMKEFKVNAEIGNREL